jgi:uncharacterized protein (UPF0332 family)
LNKLRNDGKLGLVEPSGEISAAYVEKSKNCMKSAKILLREGLFENSVVESYYAMYNSIMSLFFRCGIKCENHSASIILLGRVFGFTDLQKELGRAKSERIDSQYYISDQQNIKINIMTASTFIRESEIFILDAESKKAMLTSRQIAAIREIFSKLFSS